MIEKYLTTAEAARALDREPNLLRQWRYLKRGPKYQYFGREAQYLQSEIDRFKKALAANGGKCTKHM